MKKNKDIILKTPIDDSQMKQYLGDDVKILKYNELLNYESIDDILTSNYDFMILLYEIEPNIGHWVCMMRYDNIIEYFCSYGTYPSACLLWIDESMNKELNQDYRVLLNLLNNSKLDIIYNPIRYQEMNDDIATCGRHCISRILMMKKNSFNLNDYYKFMKMLKDKQNMSYDEIVSFLVDTI